MFRLCLSSFIDSLTFAMSMTEELKKMFDHHDVSSTLASWQRAQTGFMISHDAQDDHANERIEHRSGHYSREDT